MASLKDLFDDAADESDDGEDFKPGDEAEEAAEGEEGSPPPSPEGEGDDLEDSSGELWPRRSCFSCGPLHAAGMLSCGVPLQRLQGCQSLCIL